MKWILVIGAVLAIGCSPELQMSDGVSGAGSGGMGGGAGSGGMGGEGGDTSCEPGTVSFCYSGPEGTEEVGSCHQGVRTCNNAGDGYGECTNEVGPTVEDCGTQADESCDGRTTCSGEHLWSKMYGGTGSSRGMSVAVDATGNVITTGRISGTVDFGNGPLTTAGYYDIFISKVDAAGMPLWSKRFGDDSESSTQLQVGTSVAVDSDGNIVVAGQFVGEVDFGDGPLTSEGATNGVLFVAKFDPDGNLLWSKRLGDAESDFAIGSGAAVGIDGDDNVVVAGEFTWSIDFGGEGQLEAESSDIFVAKLAPGGALVWSKAFGNDLSNQGARSIVIDADANILMTGTFGGTLTFGSHQLTSAGSMDVFVAKLDPAGDPLWGKSFGSTGYDIGLGVALDAEKNALVAGRFSGTVDFGTGELTSQGQYNIFVVKLSQDGNTFWSRRYGTGVQQVWGITADGAGNVLIAGDFGGALDFGSGVMTSADNADAFVAKLGGNGVAWWSKRFGATGVQSAFGVAADSLGNVLVTGTAAGTVDFGGGPLTSAGTSDIFLVKLAP